MGRGHRILVFFMLFSAMLRADESQAPLAGPDPGPGVESADGADGAPEPLPEGESAAGADGALEPITWVKAVDMRPTDVTARSTVQAILNLDPDPYRALESGSSPIRNMLGAGTVFPIAAGFSLAPSLDFYSTYYALIGGRAMPIEIENRTALLFGLILSLPVQYSLELAEEHRLAFGLGPAIAARMAFRASGVPEEEQPDIEAIARYLWAGGRWFYPEASVSYSYKMADWVRFGVTARVLLPVFNWWTGEGMPFADNLIVGGGVWLSFTDFWRRL